MPDEIAVDDSWWPEPLKTVAEEKPSSGEDTVVAEVSGVGDRASDYRSAFTVLAPMELA